MAMTGIPVINDQLDTMNAILARIAMGQNLQPKSYEEIQSIVRLGLAPKVFSIGDIIEVGKETAIQASLGEHTGITGISINEEIFVTKMNEAGEKEYEFIYDGSVWKCNGENIILADYGLSVTGTPAEGDTFIVVETATVIEFQVAGFIENGKSGAIKIKNNSLKNGMILHSKKIIYGLQFDASEAMYYCEEGLAAGTYTFSISTTWGTATAGNYQFTLTQPVPAGGQIVGVYKIADVDPSNWTLKTYASALSTTEIETVSVSSGNSGTSLGELKVAKDGNMNSIQRCGYGSSNWKTSAIRQHLNSAAKAGSVWTPQTNFDRPPSWANSTAGFMHGLDPNFIKIIADCEIDTILDNVCDGTSEAATAGTNYETSIDKFFLPSRSEVYGAAENNSDKGVPFDLYKINSDYQSANGGADSNRIKVNMSGVAAIWWLRAPHPGYAYYPRSVYTSGQVGYNNACYAGGLTPACVIA